jgi:hypothetical protein
MNWIPQKKVDWDGKLYLIEAKAANIQKFISFSSKCGAI